MTENSQRWCDSWGQLSQPFICSRPGTRPAPALMLYSLLRRPAQLLLLAAVAACSSSKKDKEDPAPVVGMHWMVDGVAMRGKPGILPISNKLNFGASDTISGVGGGVIFKVPAQTGTYDLASTPNALNPASANYWVSPPTGFPVTHVATAGQVVITRYSPATSADSATLAGTFAFTASGVMNGTPSIKQVTNGKFNFRF